MCCVDMKFVKKLTSPNFLAEEFYTQKMRKSRLFMSARTSWTTFVHPSICSSPVTKSPVQPDLSDVTTDSPQSPDSPNSSDSPDSPQQVWKNFRWVKTYLLSSHFCRNFRHLLSFAAIFCHFPFIFVQISADLFVIVWEKVPWKQKMPGIPAP